MAKGSGGLSLNPKTFRDTPICELCFEDALKSGAAKTEKLKPGDLKETSIRFCIEGLRDWYSAYVDDYLGSSSLYAVIRDISWHWASHCENNDTLIAVRSEFVGLRREIAEQTSYTDLMERMKQSTRIKEFGYAARRPVTISLPSQAVGVISRTSESMGIPFSRFLQVGMGWSLSTNRNGLYQGWVHDIFTPLFDSVQARAAERAGNLAEIRVVLKYRISVANEKSTHDTAIQ